MTTRRRAPRAAPTFGDKVEQVNQRAAAEVRPYLDELLRQHGTATKADLEEGDALVPDPEAQRKFETRKAEVTRRLWRELYPDEERKLVITEITQEEEAAMPKTVKKAKAKSEQSNKQAAKKVIFEAPVLAEHDKDWGPKGRRTTLKCEFREGSVLMGIAELFTREPDKALTKKEIIAAAQKKFPDHDPKSIDMHVVWAITHLRQRYPGFNIGRDDQGRYSTLIVGRSTKRPSAGKAEAPKKGKPAPKKAKGAKKSAKADKVTNGEKKAKAPRKSKAPAEDPLLKGGDAAPEGALVDVPPEVTQA